MRAVVAIAVISCLFVVAHSIDFDFSCATRLANLAICIARQAAGISRNDTDFCNDCGNSLISYKRDCVDGVGVDIIQTGK